MLYTFDTNIWVMVLRGKIDLQVLLDRLGSHDLAVVEMVRAELLFGARVSAKPAENLAEVRGLLKPFRNLVFDESAAEKYGEVRAYLQKQGNPIGPEDLAIAATALAAGAIVVTHNTREFSRVPDLVVEDWT